MTHSLARAAALLALCALLVYAPEILTVVSAPYSTRTPERVLLRVVLCTQDAEASASFYKALSAYQKDAPAVHLRVQRVDAQQLAALSEPLPDVFCCSADQAARLPPSVPLANAGTEDAPTQVVYFPERGEPLCCAVYVGTREAAAALSLIDHLRSTSRPPDGEI
ncbi:MAG: hypothetical protein ACI4PG_05340 [Candidatus Ventricola sp.]